MYRNILLPQLKRAPWRTALFVVLLAIATAFFCLSGNLYQNSKKNITSTNDAFSTVAYLEFFQSVNQYGEHIAVTDDDYAGTFSVAVNDTDFNVLLSLPGVKYADRRAILGAYIPNAVTQCKHHLIDTYHVFKGDIIRFTIRPDSVVQVDSDGIDTLQIDVINNANQVFHYDQSQTSLHFAIYINNETVNQNHPTIDDLSIPVSIEQNQQIRQFNRGVELPLGSYILEPNVEYVGFVNNGTAIRLQDGKFRAIGSTVVADYYGAEHFAIYKHIYHTNHRFSTHVHSVSRVSADQPFWLWRWEDVQNDSELLAYFDEVAQAYEYSAHSFAVMPTQDLNGIPGFYQKKVHVKEGREFSEEDYAEGNRVCIVSAALAKYQDWQVGDTVDMRFYRYDGFFEGGNDGTEYEGYFPIYTKDNGGFFDQGEYTIIGIWDEYPVQISSSLDEYTNNLEYNTILVPTSSVQNLDTVDAPASGSRLTVHLENGRMEEFLEAASKVTLSESADEVRITAFDQGYSEAQDSLQSMLGTAQFLLVLASVLLIVAGVLLAFFYTQSQKQNMALMRLLGCNRRQAGTMSLLGSLLILLPGGLLGVGAGHLLTDRVANAILNSTSALDKPEYAGFREIFGMQAEVDFALAAQPTVSAVALAIAAGLFLAGCLFFTLLLLRKEPQEALQDK